MRGMKGGRDTDTGDLFIFRSLPFVKGCRYLPTDTKLFSSFFVCLFVWRLAQITDILSVIKLRLHTKTSSSRDSVLNANPRPTIHVT